MAKSNDGGPAFPVITSESIRRVPEGHCEEVAFHTAPSMTLRDWFAGQVLGQVYISANQNFAKMVAPTLAKAVGRTLSIEEMAEILNSPDAKELDGQLREAVAETAYKVADAMLAERAKGGA